MKIHGENRPEFTGATGEGSCILFQRGGIRKICDHVAESNFLTVVHTDNYLESCEHCNSTGTELPFDRILDRATGCDSTVTDYVIDSSRKCPHWRRQIFEKTLVDRRAFSFLHVPFF